MNINLRLTIFLGFFWSFSVIAGSDPVSCVLNPASGFPATPVGGQSVVRYTCTNNMSSPKSITVSTTSTGGGFVVFNDCNGVALAKNAHCVITVAFNPTAAGTSTFQLTYGYDNNRIPLPRLIAVSTGTPVINLSGTLSGLPATMNTNSIANFSATYTNNGTSALSGCSFPDFTSCGVAVTSLTTSPGVPECGSTLAAGASCHMRGQVTTSTATGDLTITGHANCTGASASPQASTVVSSATSCVNVTTVLPLPSTTHTYSDNIAQFQLNNTCSSAATLSSPTISATGVNATVTQASASPLTTCTSSLAAHSSCSVSASVIPQGSGSMTVQVNVTANGSALSASTNATVAAPNYTHTVNFINQCPFPVWYGVENSPSNPNVQDPTPNPTPSAYLLTAQTPGSAPVVKSITIPGTYLGEFFARTGCSVQGSNFVCETADCTSPASTGQCNGDAFSPFTRIEEVFFSSIQGAGYQGTYDLSLVNGENIPVEFKGLGPSNSNTPFSDTPFYCTGTGAPIQPPQPAGVEPLGVCTWSFSPSSISSSLPDQQFNFVTYTSSVSDCSACTGSQVCGLAFTGSASSGNITLSCGNLIGHWTINQSCGSNVHYMGLPATNNPQNVFHCATLVSGYPDAGTTNYSVYSCVTPAGPNPNQLGSCYPSTATNPHQCCGAQNWDMSGTYYGSYLTAQDLTSNPVSGNPDWTGSGQIQNPTPYQSIVWIKQACPTAYSYPYDDHSVSFRCYTSDSAQTNPVRMDFDVVFCPGGLTGGVITP